MKGNTNTTDLRVAEIESDIDTLETQLTGDVWGIGLSSNFKSEYSCVKQIGKYVFIDKTFTSKSTATTAIGGVTKNGQAVTSGVIKNNCLTILKSAGTPLVATISASNGSITTSANVATGQWYELNCILELK